MINPSEISQVLKQQLENVNSKIAFEEVGTVLEVGDGVAHVYGLDNVGANELVEFENGVKGVALNLEESNVGVILLNQVNKVTENMTVRRTGEIASIPVGEGLLGRVVNILGEPIDGRGPVAGDLIRSPPSARQRFQYASCRTSSGRCKRFAGSKISCSRLLPISSKTSTAVSISSRGWNATGSRPICTESRSASSVILLRLSII